MGCEVDGRFFTWKIFFPQKLIGPYFTFFANTCPLWIRSYLAVKFFTTWTIHPHISGHRKSKRLFPRAEVSACSKHNHFHFKRMQDSKWKRMKMHENFKNCGGKKSPFELLNLSSQIIICLPNSEVNFHRSYHMGHTSDFQDTGDTPRGTHLLER